MARGFWEPLENRRPVNDSNPVYGLGLALLVLAVVLLLGSCFAAGYLLAHFNQQEVHHVHR